MTLLGAQWPEASRQRSEKCERCERTLNTFHAHMSVCAPLRTFRRSVNVPAGDLLFALVPAGLCCRFLGQCIQASSSSSSVLLWSFSKGSGFLLSIISKRWIILRNIWQLLRLFCSSPTVKWQKVLLSCVTQYWSPRTRVPLGPHLVQ